VTDELLPLRCPYCGSEIEAELTYSGYAYSEHRDLTGYECESFACDARWDKRGEPERGSKLRSGVVS
jgi:sarcosine oxidase delta subunit